MPMIGNTAQLKEGQKKAPVAPAAAGRMFFVNNCAVCHGTTGQGDDGPNLHGLKLSDAAITSIVAKGFKGQMPAFQSKLKAQDVKALIAYLRILKK
jgi:mono/diheme cytochrome c family protein